MKNLQKNLGLCDGTSGHFPIVRDAGIHETVQVFKKHSVKGEDFPDPTDDPLPQRRRKRPEEKVLLGRRGL
jgi:hypothetical protein